MFAGTHPQSFFGWAGDITSLVVTVGVAIALGLVGTSSFVVNLIDRKSVVPIAVAALALEPVLAAGFARGSVNVPLRAP